MFQIRVGLLAQEDQDLLADLEVLEVLEVREAPVELDTNLVERKTRTLNFVNG